MNLPTVAKLKLQYKDGDRTQSVSGTWYRRVNGKWEREK